jgi:hypothetical protein
MSHAWQLALARPCVYSVLSALSLMSGCMFRQLAIARPCVYSVYLSALGSPMSGCMFGLESTVLLWYTKSELLIHGFHANQGRAAHTGTMGIAARVDRGRTPLTAHGPRPLADDGGRPSRTASTTSSYYVLATSRGALEHLLEDAACGGLPHARHDKRHDAIPKRSWVS